MLEPLLGEIFLKIYEITQMSQNAFKSLPLELNSEIVNCFCVQILKYTKESEHNLKLRMQRKTCPNLPESVNQIRMPKKAMNRREQQLKKAEIKQRVYDN